MKVRILLILLFFSLQIFAQDRRDKLLERDNKQIVERLQIMDYLADATMKLKYYLKKDSGINFKQYFADTIAGKYPDPDKIYKYLYYKPSRINITPDKFYEDVYENNAFSFYAMIVRYGYPSVFRLHKYFKVRPGSGHIYLTMAPDKWKREIYPLIEYEYSEGNMTEPEYEFCKMAIRGPVSREEMDKFNAKMEKWGYKTIKS